MAEKKKLTTAEILAMARGKAAAAAESKSAAEPPPSGGQSPSTESAAASNAAETPAAASPAAKSKPAAKPAASSGGRPSVAEMLAMARNKDGGKPDASAAPAAAKPAEKKPVEKKVADKPVAKPAAKPTAGPAKSGGPVDTASILAAARSGAKPGPMTKAEAAATVKPAPKAKPAALVMPAKPDYAKSSSAKPRAKATAGDETRRGFLHVMLGSFLGVGMTSIAGVSALWTLGLARFMFPNILTEPPSRFKAGPKEAFAPGVVETKYKAQYGVWIVNGEYNGKQELYALKSVCTHLGCTPNWLEAEQKFKCPCHGSGFYKDGINFEGPAPRPLERYAIRISDDGQVEIDRSHTFQEELGQWSDPASFIPGTA
ncbi:MAG: ubiquinol-cytochrome c reductase iron-sulfur subunit [Pirellulales bacterium]